jgi:N-acetyl-anhydromuramyl-L-alanine amidase AmpD
MSITIQQVCSTAHTTAKYNRTISYIVIHYTAGTRSTSGVAAAVAKMFATSTTNASADFIVDDENIVQYNPDIKNLYCWHCGGSNYGTKGGSLYGVAKNANSIGIEICSTNSSGKVTSPNDARWSYTDKAVDKARELVKFLMATYGIDQYHVIRHYDVTGKLCPGIIGWNADSGDESKWNSFLASLTDETKKTTKEEVDMTKAEVTALIEEIVDEKLSLVTDISDTGNSPSSWAKEGAAWAINNGLIAGDGNGNYGWNKAITREQMAVILQRLLNLFLDAMQEASDKS